MPERLNERFPSRYGNADEKAGRRRTRRYRTHSPTAVSVTSGRARSSAESDTDAQYLSIPISPLLGKRFRWSIEIHKGFAICLIASAVLWTGIIAVIRAI
jgi:hypothetical protein